MKQQRFDELTKLLGRKQHRRTVLKGALLTALGGALPSMTAGGALASACREAGHPCEGLGNVCCPGLVCGQPGPGAAARCLACPEGYSAINGECVCNGCVDAQGTCQPGTSNGACGSGGAACSTCATETVCRGGTCVPCAAEGAACNVGLDCCSDLCFVDENGRGTCVLTCPDGTAPQNGQCVPACDQSNCATGCCDDQGICHVADNQACGTAAGVCAPCSADQVCRNGACTPCVGDGQSCLVDSDCCSGVCLEDENGRAICQSAAG